MPIISHSKYRRPWYLFNRHLETVLPFYTFDDLENIYDRERLELPDGDFLDLDWLSNNNNRLIILSHGLEGNSHSHYIKQATRFFSKKNWDVLAWHFRSCSKELNRSPRLYSGADSDDLKAIIFHALEQKKYGSVILIGFSLGAITTLKLLSETNVPSAIKGAVTFSVPCDFSDSMEQLKGINRIYEKQFLKKLHRKILRKKEQYRKSLNFQDIDQINSLVEFIERFTVPLCGFEDINDFYKESSPELSNITTPTLIVNALNDPLLGSKCYPFEVAKKSEYIFLETPTKGGHCGFSLHGKGHSWMEERSALFINEVLGIS
ncbi:MAG: alpha/beta hydrolase [Cyclobacteriaceae bacterium]